MNSRNCLRFLKCLTRRYCTEATNTATEELKHTYKIASTTLSLQLKARIKACGPITVADYMREVLTNPLSGYYMNKDVFGQEGDFTTSPEISQLFGEMFAIWCINEWNKIGSPKPLQIIELGPGRGTLCEDILRVFNHFKLTNDISVHLVEVSPHLSRMQSEKLCNNVKENPDDACYMTGTSKYGNSIYWYKRLQDVPEKFSIVLAHEFFDALPIHKFQKTKNGWREVLVDFEPNEQKFRYIISRSETPTARLFINEKETRDHLEISPDSIVMMEHLASRLEENGGFALLADYGHDGEKTDTFRAFKNHQLHDPLIDPGTADLTADVDFSQLRKYATLNDKLITFGPVTQNHFLTQLGIETRLKILTQNLEESDKELIKQGYNMIMDTDKMGERFKMMSFFPSVLRDHLKKYPVIGFIK